MAAGRSGPGRIVDPMGREALEQAAIGPEHADRGVLGADHLRRHQDDPVERAFQRRLRDEGGGCDHEAFQPIGPRAGLQRERHAGKLRPNQVGRHLRRDFIIPSSGGTYRSFPKGEGMKLQRVVVAVDESDAGRWAARAALDLAAGTGAELVVLRTVSILSRPAPGR